MSSIFMETTEIAAEKTIGEIQGVLGRAGASSILVDYKNREATAIAFKFKVDTHEVPFLLPCRWEAIQKVLDKKRPPKTRIYRGTVERIDNVAQSKRVAWRQILRWVQAQMALVETEMVKVEEVFLPYIQTRSGRTLYEITAKADFNLAALEFKS